jgi:predicted DNA-binding protein
MSGPKTSRQSDQFKLRMPDGMRDRLAKEAGKHGRTITQEIILRLEETFLYDETNPTANAMDAVREIVRDVRKAASEMKGTQEQLIDLAEENALLRAQIDEMADPTMKQIRKSLKRKPSSED